MGDTGGALAYALLILGRIRGVRRPALIAPVPTRTGKYCAILDVGANAECKPEYLLQFGIMAAVYVEHLWGRENPRGNVEPKEVFAGEVDVAVTDGFTGNVVLKTMEALTKLITDALKEGLTLSWQTKLGALLARPGLRRMKSRLLDPVEIGAVPLLGVNGLVFIGHGRFQGPAVLSGIARAREAVAMDLVGKLRDRIAASLTPQEDAAS